MKRWPHDERRRSWMAFGVGLVTFLCITLVVSELVTNLLWRIWRMASTTRMPYAEGVLSLCSLLLAVVVAYRLARLVFEVLRQPRVEDQTTFCGRCGYNLTGNVSGQCPECGMDDVQYVIWHFEHRERLQRLKAATMIAFGIPISFLGPIVLATMFWFVLISFQFGSNIQWFNLFIVLTAVVVPLLYRLELRTGGDYLTTVLRESDVHGMHGFAIAPGFTPEIGAFSNALANPRAMSSVFVEFFLFGPRMAIGGFRQAKVARRVRLADPKRAALVITLLIRRNDGIQTADVIEEGESMADVLPIIVYLTFHQWVGVGKEWQRVWLDSKSRRLLEG